MFPNIRLYEPQKKLIKNLVVKSGEYDICFGNSEEKIIHKLLIADHHFYARDIHNSLSTIRGSFIERNLYMDPNTIV